MIKIISRSNNSNIPFHLVTIKRRSKKNLSKFLLTKSIIKSLLLRKYQM